MKLKTFLYLCTVALATTALPAQSSLDPNFVVGKLSVDPLERLGITRKDLGTSRGDYRFDYMQITRYLNDSSAAVTSTFDDTSENILPCLEALDKYGVKASIAVNTAAEDMHRIWPALREAVENGHEISSHSRRHPCEWDSTRAGTTISAEFCRSAYNRDELAGSRDDILANTQQAYVWSFVYPCGNCADYDFIHRRLADVGYLAARAYPDETKGLALRPGLDDWAFNAYNARYTQAIQNPGGVAPSGMTDLKSLNKGFDKVIEKGGIYHMVSHPSWLEFGEEDYFQKHLEHIGGRKEVWYVPFGPLYAYRSVVEHSAVMRLKSENGSERFAVSHDLDSKIYSMSLTVKFAVPADTAVTVSIGDRVVKERAADRLTDRWDEEYLRREGERLFVTLRPPAIVTLR